MITVRSIHQSEIDSTNNRSIVEFPEKNHFEDNISPDHH